MTEYLAAFTTSLSAFGDLIVAFFVMCFALSLIKLAMWLLTGGRRG